MPDFSILRQPDFAAAALGGYQAGHALGQQRRLDAALGAVDLSRPETVMPVLQLDPATGSALLNASTKMIEQRRATQGRSALSDFLIARQGGGDPTTGAQGAVTPPVPSSSAPGAAGQAPAEASPPGDVVVTANTLHPSLAQAERHYMELDPEGYVAVQQHIGALDENRRKALADTAQAQASVALQAKALPYSQRRAFIHSQAGFLSQHGVTPDQIEAFDPTDEAIGSQITQALGVQGMLQQQDREHDNALQDRNVNSEIASRGLHNDLAVQAGARGAASRAEAHTRYTERNNPAPSHGGASPPAVVRYQYRTLPDGTVQRRAVP